VSAPDHERIKAIFIEAAALAPCERSKFVAEACGNDAPLRNEVESLLEHDDSRTIIVDETTPDEAKRQSAPLATAGPLPSPGSRLGQYLLEELIGEGGMAVVFRARHVTFNRPAAVKLVKPGQATESMLARFDREVQFAGRLTHPNTINKYDHGRTPEGIFYCAMELVAGLNLAQVVALDGTVPTARAVHLLRQIGGSLREAHGLGLVHGDVKPQNIMLCGGPADADVVKVLDFGLVRSVHREDSTSDAGPALLAGTPPYMAPEQLLDPQKADPRSDIYSLGAVAFKLLTAKDVFAGKDVADVLAQAIEGAAPRPADVAPQTIPAELDHLIVGCLAKQLDDRPPTIDDVLGVLERLATVYPWEQSQAQRWWREKAARFKS
jgi:serine/threonine protein kinase